MGIEECVEVPSLELKSRRKLEEREDRIGELRIGIVRELHESTDSTEEKMACVGSISGCRSFADVV